MKYASITKRLEGLGGAKWQVHLDAKKLADAGQDIILMTIGEPDVDVPVELRSAAIDGIHAGRTKYSDGQGEETLREALGEYYTKRSKAPIGPENILCVPGTQTALYTAFAGLVEAGDEVLVGDPMYATYEAVVRASGADMVPVPLRPEHGFRMQATDIAACITPRTRAVLLTTPHNPTGAILTRDDIAAIGALAQQHDFWIISDEVYSEMIFEGETFASPLDFADLRERVVAVSSISKSHAAPGFRSGWCVASAKTISAILPVAEAMLFGNQPFIADMTVHAVREGSSVAAGMRTRFAARAARMDEVLGNNQTCLKVHRPQAGMFGMIDVSGTGFDGEAFALALLDAQGVAVMPGSSFGDSLQDWVRVALTIDDETFETALQRIKAFVSG
ncbi:pyridoxal phosphate-dependent aminotransferase [Yoonia sp. I 8.24]|uniref:pyridoxal phosphate-dependent aminotransferase n=1 Tax=Yoonia sp. I 8.24 TaxID=1537229 RepID=UPI001EDE937C|nr:pyridoxal phosphate-dependent aminotransferase [Yoonia sp. I 8.24]MCG3268356.1 pyridoxal phosphate-dependent aminotransferase [Yoonia sp. I 8.24]